MIVGLGWDDSGRIYSWNRLKMRSRQALQRTFTTSVAASIMTIIWARTTNALVIPGIYIYVYTSSTAQGGGGSFKNRKPIGEVGCCESGMAERSH